MNRGAQRYKWNFGQGTMEEEDGQRVMQVHSMDIPYNADRIQVAELVNSPQMSMMPPRPFGHGQRLSPSPMNPSPSPSPLLMNTYAPSPPQIQMQQEEEQMSSPDMKKKKTKKKKKTDSPSNSPKGRGRYACLLHRQKHKRCPPDCPERKPKPMKSGGSAPSSPKSPSSPRKAKVQINAIELNSPQEALVAESVNTSVIPHTLRPMAYPTAVIPQPGQLMATGPVERIQWEAPPVWEDLSTWHELHPANNWSAWEDLRSSTHWEESKVQVKVKVEKQEFDTSQFLIDEKQLQMSDSPEGSELITDVAMTDV